MWNKLKSLSGVSDLLYSGCAILLALGIGAIFIWLSGYGVVKAYSSLLNGAVGTRYNLAQSLLKAIPLMFTGLAVAIGFKTALFNIGGEGQLYWGAFATAVTALALPQLPRGVLLPLALLAGACAGGVWGAIPGYLKAKTGAHEVVTTIMLNYIGILLTTFLLKNYVKESGPIDQTRLIPEAARFSELLPHSRLTWAFVFGISVIWGCDFLFKKTAFGYDLQAVGENPSAAEYAGINAPRQVIIAMTLSGAVAGLAGSTMVMGVLNRFITNFSPGYGFTGIAVAVLGRNAPWGVLLAALLFGALESGGMAMQLFAKIPMDLMIMVQGLVILFVAAPAIIRLFAKLLQRRSRLL